MLRTLSNSRAKAARKIMLSGVAGRTRMMAVGDWRSSHRGTVTRSIERFRGKNERGRRCRCVSVGGRREGLEMIIVIVAELGFP